MKLFKYSLLASAITLAGCGAELQESEKVELPDISAEDLRDQSLNTAETFYAFPANGQSDIPLNATVLLSFSHEISKFYPISVTVTDSSGNEVAGELSVLPENGKGVKFIPAAKLKAAENYTVNYEVSLVDPNDDTQVITTAQETKFKTRAALSADLFQLDTDATGNEVGIFPTADFPFTTFSTVRLRFTNEIDLDTLVQGESFKFQKVGTTIQVPGDLIAKGRYITFDPAEDLEDDASYELIITSDVQDIAGNALSPINKILVAQSVGERSFSTMNVTSNLNEILSPFSGEAYNAVAVQSVLIGKKEKTYVEADLITELAHLGQFKSVSPLTIRKGTVMNSSSLDVNVGGKFPAGFESGNVRMTTISDATGYLIDNSNSDHEFAPQQLRLVMDVAMTADGYEEGDGSFNGRANGALSQDIMHLEIVGSVRTVGKQMIIDAVGEIDLSVMGIENAHAQVSFHMESYTADDAPVIPVDTKPPFLQSWFPAEKTSNFSLDEEIILNFDEPLELSSIKGIRLEDKDGITIATNISLDGSAVIIDPVESLVSASDYTLSGGVKDLAGNDAYIVRSFSTPYTTQATRATSPMVETMVPGYACAMYGYDYANDIAGRCAGGLETDQKFNIFSLQEDRDIFIAFSQPIDERSLVLGNSCDTGSFRVEVVDTNGTCLDTVPGVMSYDNKILTFTPNAGWKDQGENFYRYALMTAKNLTKGQVDCTDGSAVCSEASYPLQTTLLKGNSVEDQGGPHMRVPFRAAPADNLVFNPLMMPSTDNNRDYRWNEGLEAVYGGNFAKLAVTDWGGLITSAKIGCASDQSCSEDKSKTFISAFMATEIGEYDPVNNRIPVKVHAQQMISSDVFVEAKIVGIGSEVPTGTMIMRPIHPVVDGKTQVPTGYIIWNEEEGRLNFKIDLEVYMDNPFMHVTLDLEHNLHSYVIPMNLQGPIEFLDDGRMMISLLNKNSIDLNVSIGGGTATLTLNLAPGAVSLTQISMPMK